jgi:hypothetical protein
MAGLTGVLPKNDYGDLLNAGNAGAGIPAGLQQIQDGLGNNTGLTLSRTAGVLISALSARTTSSPTNATATMSSGVLSDLTLTLLAGAKYFGTLVLFAKNSTAAEGLQFDLNGGSATMTSIEFGFAATPPGASLALGVLTSTALGTALTVTTATTADAVYTIQVGLVVANAGTLIPRFAEVSHTSGTATVEVNSYFFLQQSTN